MPVSAQVTQPKTHKGRKFLESRAPKIVENDKNTLVLKGGHTSECINDFLNDICTLKSPLVSRLKWRNPVLPFEDLSFIEKMCRKYDCSMFVIGLHSKKRPNNVVMGRLYDGELLDMFEFGLTNYKGISPASAVSFGTKPMMLFSGETFEEERKNIILKSLLIDLFRGPIVEGVRSLGVELLFQITMVSEGRVSFQTRHIAIKPVKKPGTESQPQEETESPVVHLRTPWGMPVQLDVTDNGPSFQLTLRRVTLPSEDKWKCAHRVPPETRLAQKVKKNRHTDVFGSRVGRVHVGKSKGLEKMHPASSLRTALTGRRKRGFERHEKKVKKGKGGGEVSEPNSKRVRVDAM